MELLLVNTIITNLKSRFRQRRMTLLTFLSVRFRLKHSWAPKAITCKTSQILSIRSLYRHFTSDLFIFFSRNRFMLVFCAIQQRDHHQLIVACYPNPDQQVDTHLFWRFNLMAEYVAASYCLNNNNSPNHQISCPEGNCQQVEEAYAISSSQPTNSVMLLSPKHFGLMKCVENCNDHHGDEDIEDESTFESENSDGFSTQATLNTPWFLQEWPGDIMILS